MRIKHLFPSKTTTWYIIGMIVGAATGNPFQTNNLENISELEHQKTILEMRATHAEEVLKQLPNWDSTRFYDWSAGYEFGSKWQMAVYDLNENYVHKDSRIHTK